MSTNIKGQQILVKDGVGMVVNPHKEYHLKDLHNVFSSMDDVIRYNKPYRDHNQQFASYSFSTNAEDEVKDAIEFGEEVWRIKKRHDKEWQNAHKSYYSIYKAFNDFKEWGEGDGVTQVQIYRHHTPATVKKPVESNHFYLQSDNGVTAHVNMDPNADKETVNAVKKMIDLAYDLPATTEQAGEVEKIALELYPVAMHSPSSHPSNWDMNEQYRKVWVKGYNYQQPTIDRLTDDNKALREALEWISVKDRLPESNTRVLACESEDGQLFAIVDCSYKGMNLFMEGKKVLDYITHWTPLPNPLQFALNKK